MQPVLKPTADRVLNVGKGWCSVSIVGFGLGRNSTLTQGSSVVESAVAVLSGSDSSVTLENSSFTVSLVDMDLSVSLADPELLLDLSELGELSLEQ